MVDAHELLQGLNEAQRRGATHAGSPLIVLAGPGTGKTRLITSRVAHLVLEHGADPASIVAVTFTNKAAEELRERLADLIGPGAADSVRASTFHGFGLRLLRRFPDLSGVGAAPEIIDSAQRRRLLRSLAGEHGVYGPLLAFGAEALLQEAAGTIELCRHNALSPEDCRGFAARWGELLEQGVGCGGEELDGDALAAQREERARFAAHAELYGHFERACRERGWLTIDELITLPTRLLAQHERVRAICRHEHRHVVVDEFQDVNLAQIEFLRRLAPPERSPDLVVVGDDDQSIYEFRGADDRAFARFAKIWSDAETVELTENYRSAPPVLAVANAVIGRAPDRFAPEKRVERAAALRGEPVAAGAGVEIVQLESDGQCRDVVAAMVREELAREPEGPLSRVAVIARTHAELDGVGEALELEGIPAQRHARRGAADDEGVRDLLAWMELLVRPEATWSVRRALARPPCGAPPERLAAWEQEFQRRRRVERLDGAGGGEAYAAWLAREKGEDEAAAGFVALHAELLEQSQRMTASDMVWTIVTRLDLAHADLLGGRDRARRIEALVRVIRFVRGVQHRLEAPGDLAAFWSYYNDLDERDRCFGPLGQDLVECDEEGDERVQNAVQLLTAHGAKGLEFDVVFVPRVNPPHGYPKTAGGERACLPEGLVDRLGDERDGKARQRAEERRIFYVAATRAQRRLVLLTRKTKTRSKSEHYAQELLYDESALVVVRDADEVLGAGEGGDAIEHAAPAGAAREMRRRAAEAEKRAARARAAAALDRAEGAGGDAGAIEEAVRAFREAAERAAVASAMESGGEAPAWASGEALAVAERLGALAGAEAGDEGDGYRFRAMTPPIDISYTTIDQYTRCPACFYVRHVLRLGEPPTAQLTTGGLVHAALEWHARAWRDAEAEGGERPACAALEEHARRLFRGMVHDGGEGDALHREEVVAMVRRGHEMMTGCGAEILEIERKITMPYEVDGVGHRLIAKLDRVDRTAEGVRIVDYKTGGSSEAKRSPKSSDLQLGIYAMAIRHEMPEVRGVAEYWVLRTGERGSIALDEIDEAKVRGKIDEVVRGLSEGRYPRIERTCAGLCALVGG